jgi:curli biogenesis system outer membrane secretion channel CsgG
VIGTTKYFAQSLPLAAMAALLAGCLTTGPTVGDKAARTVVTGSAGGATAQGESSQLRKCPRPLGTLALVENAGANWYRVLTAQYSLPSTLPVLRLMIQQSNCFIIVERGRAMAHMQHERELQLSGELRGNSQFGKGQMVSADYSLSPEVTFSERDTGALGGVLGMLSPVAGMIAGGVRTHEAATVLTLVDNRSGVQVAAAEGSSRNTDFALGAFLGVGSGGGGMGGYTNTPQGKVVIAAFMDAFNQLATAAGDYRPQSMGSQGLGTGGKLAVDGAATSSAPAAASASPLTPPAAVALQSPTPSATAAVAAPPSNRSGPAVRAAQSQLTRLGYDVGTADGQLGRKTVAALREFQADRRLPVTGALDPATQDELQR